MIALWLAAAAHAGAWTREPGQLYTKVGADGYRAFRFVSPGTAAEGDGAYFGQQYSLYGEFGVLPVHKGQLALGVPVVIGTLWSEIFDPFGALRVRATTARMGDLRATAQVALHPDLPLALAAEVKVPLYANGSVGAELPTLSSLFPLPGDGQVDVTTWVYAGASPADATFVEGGVGWRHRTEVFVGWDTPITFVDGITWNLKGGRTFGKVIVILGTDGVVNPVSDRWSRQYAALFGSALIDVAPGLAIEPRLAGEVWALNASQGIGGGLGLSYRR